MGLFEYKGTVRYQVGRKTRDVEEFVHSKTGIEFVYIPAGSYLMGSDDMGPYEGYRTRWDTVIPTMPVHEVRVPAFLLAKYECTQAQWECVMGVDPSYHRAGERLSAEEADPTRPVEMISWDDVQNFYKRTGLRLPTEEEWEYACRAGSKGEYFFGNASELGQYAWYSKSSEWVTHPVGQLMPNLFGLYDIYGNVWEMCSDSWRKNYSAKPDKNQLTVRGGSYSTGDFSCRSATRGGFPKKDVSGSIGFRPAADLSMID